jgi:HSP20 family protein
MSNVPKDSFHELQALQLRLHRLFQEFERPPDSVPQSADWAPAADILETGSCYVIKADLPEVGPGDIKVEFKDGFLTIHGVRRRENEEKGVKYHRIEREYGRFSRRFAMPADVKAGNVYAEFKDSVLVVILPKNGQAGAGAHKPQGRVGASAPLSDGVSNAAMPSGDASVPRVAGTGRRPPRSAAAAG